MTTPWGYNLRKYPHPGKYEGGLMIDEYVHRVSMVGCDDTAGSVQELGWAGLIRGELAPTQEFLQEFEFLFTQEELKFLASVAGAIIEEDDQGFVSVSYFDSADKLERTWANIQRDLEREEKEV
jgi:hypothetical protein